MLEWNSTAVAAESGERKTEDRSRRSFVLVSNGRFTVDNEGFKVARKNRIRQQIRSVRNELKSLARSIDRLASMVRDTGASEPVGRPTRRLTLSPKRRSQLKLHGQYIGSIRQLKPAQKSRVKALREQKGYRAAIVLANKLAGKR